MMKNNEIRRQAYTPGLHIRQREDGGQSRTITGYAILFGSESAPLWQYAEGEDREVIDPGAVTLDLLNSSNILMTMFHDRSVILARSKNGSGTLTYSVDEKGVSFEFEAPNTAEGDKALELVKRGDIDGCSFAFTTKYYNDDYVTPVTEARDGKLVTIYHVKVITGIYDFTLTPDPAYPDTSCEAERDLFRSLHPAPTEERDNAQREKEEAMEKKVRAQVDALRAAAAKRIFV